MKILKKNDKEIQIEKQDLKKNIKREVSDAGILEVSIEDEFISVKKSEYEILKTRYGIAKPALESVLFFIVPENLRNLVNNAMKEIAEVGLNVNKK